jgi:hypothetical protein
MTTRELNVAYIVTLAVALLLAASFLFWPKAAVSNYEFAKCLTDKGVTMYGTDTCDACQSQKNIFKGEFEQIHYVNCSFDFTECSQNRISKYPTWKKGGYDLIGVQSLETLSVFSGCEL